jgi:alpha-L-fucosidase
MNNKTSGRIFLNPAIVIAVLFILVTLGYAQSPGPETEQEREERMKWWREARFGMFIHWGPVSLKGTEIGWSRGREVPIREYDNLYKSFNPEKFDAQEWVQIAKDAGMKYVVITSKHHDGFCLWDSKYTDYDIMSTPFKRDVIKELADQCRRQGITFNTYFSIIDWYQADYLPRGRGDKRPVEGADFERYVKYMKNQLREIVTKYGPLGIMWFDGEWENHWTPERGWDLYRYVRSLQPDILVNNRVGKGRQGMKGITKKDREYAGDYATPEQEIGQFNIEDAWETNMTICRQWAWKPNDKMKSLKECIQTLARVVGGDGNFLFNVGPMPDGRIEPRQVERLREMGQWLKINGESIYGTRGGPLKPGRWGASTHKGNRIYVHVFDWPKDGELELPLPRNDVIRAYLLAYEQLGDLLLDSDDKNNLVITIPRKAPDPIDAVVVLEKEAGPEATPQAKDGSVNLKAMNAVVRGEYARYESGGGKDNIGYWTNPADYVIWRFNVTKPGTFNVEMSQACADGSGGSKYVLAVGAQELAGIVKDTGGWTSFVTEKLGTLKLTKAGTYTLSVKPKTMPSFAVMNLKSVTLIPVKK